MASSLRTFLNEHATGYCHRDANAAAQHAAMCQQLAGQTEEDAQLVQTYAQEAKRHAEAARDCELHAIECAQWAEECMGHFIWRDKNNVREVKDNMDMMQEDMQSDLKSLTTRVEDLELAHPSTTVERKNMQSNVDTLTARVADLESVQRMDERERDIYCAHQAASMALERGLMKGLKSYNKVKPATTDGAA